MASSLSWSSVTTLVFDSCRNLAPGFDKIEIALVHLESTLTSGPKEITALYQYLGLAFPGLAATFDRDITILCISEQPK